MISTWTQLRTEKSGRSSFAAGLELSGVLLPVLLPFSEVSRIAVKKREPQRAQDPLFAPRKDQGIQWLGDPNGIRKRRKRRKT